MELDLIKTDIIELAEQTSDIIKYHASQKGLELLLNIQHDMPRFAVADPIRLKQILVNLLGNAVKFTESGEVELKVTFAKKDEISGNFSFSIRDTGIGINKEQQKQLFKAFTQADSSTTRKFGGTGLGLTISNMLAEKMGSKIELISETGKGSNFFFTIETEFEVGEKLDYSSLIDIHRVLVIDDNNNNRMILEHTFKNWGIEFTGIDNGLSALKLMEKSNPFDVIIVDYHMPYLNGIDTIKMIRQQLNLTPEKQPVILLHSSSDDVEIHEACKRLGVRFNLAKPVKSQELLNYLRCIRNQPAEEAKGIKKTSQSLTYGTANESSPVILVAEDVALNRLLATTLIKQMIPNVTVLEAKNGREAFDMAIALNPDLILMDVQMPEISGIEATVEIRNYELGKGSRIPIVALTAGAVKGEKEKCLEAGMDDFLTKPVDRNALLTILEKYQALDLTLL
jgi:CheY-like chemotaxis protein